ncbi:MAG TPA: hypothetical protein VI076_17565, partial [Actinopolymorphaceae bacterium]
MATLLYRLGRFASRRSWVVIATWVIVLACAGAAFVIGRGPMSSGFDIPGTETATVTQSLR